MKVVVQFYAQLRDIVGQEEIDIELAEAARVSDLLARLYQQFPALGGHDNTILLGVGVEFVDRSYQLKPGDEIAIMPPVQGG